MMFENWLTDLVKWRILVISIRVVLVEWWEERFDWRGFKRERGRK